MLSFSSGNMAQSSDAGSDVLDLYLKEAQESFIREETTSVNMEKDRRLNPEVDISHLESNDDLKISRHLIKNVSFSGAIIAQSSYADSNVLELYCDETLESSDGEETTSVNIENDTLLNSQVNNSHHESNAKLILSHHLIKNVSFSGGIMASLESDKGLNREHNTPLNRQVQVESPTTPHRSSPKRFRCQSNPHLLLRCQNYADMLSFYRFSSPKFKPCATSTTKRFGDSQPGGRKRSVG